MQGVSQRQTIGTLGFFTIIWLPLFLRFITFLFRMLIILILLILIGLNFLRLLGPLLFGWALPPTLACENLVAEKIINQEKRRDSESTCKQTGKVYRKFPHELSKCVISWRKKLKFIFNTTTEIQSIDNS